MLRLTSLFVTAVLTAFLLEKFCVSTRTLDSIVMAILGAAVGFSLGSVIKRL